MIIVTGGAGFIGSNLVAALNQRGETDILVVDDLTDGTKFENLSELNFCDYQDKLDFLNRIETGRGPRQITAVLHQGACSDTTEWDGRLMMRDNYDYSKLLLNFCHDHKVPFIYASSASVYGGGREFRESPDNERPLNVYGFSKLMFDRYVRRRLPLADCQIVGLRYFNVYGPNEAHKGPMASVAYHFNRQIETEDEARLFEGADGFEAGEQRRDFVYVGDIAEIVMWFLEHEDRSGIFNAGTGASQTFNDVANAVISVRGRGRIRYIPFPDHLRGHYQSFTEANLTALREAGYDGDFLNVEQGVRAYLGQ